MRLLVDLGNSRVKWGTVDTGGDLGGVHAHAWDKRIADILHDAWAAVRPVQGVWAASVVDGAREAAVSAAALACFGRPVTWVRTLPEAHGVRIAYADPRSMGVDRLLGMIAARADRHAPCVLATVGTALVLDALAADGRHLGGLIAPGPRLMRQSVLDATAAVRPGSPGRVTDAADNTADALLSGCWQACGALVDRFVRRMAGNLGGMPELLLGGGDAGALLPLVEHTATHYPDAVLRGLAIWAAGES